MGPPAYGQAIEFISAVLSQRGPQAVPYEERHKWTVREHLSDLLKVQLEDRRNRLQLHAQQVLTSHKSQLVRSHASRIETNCSSVSGLQARQK